MSFRVCSHSAYYIAWTIDEALNPLPAQAANNKFRIAAACVAATLSGGCASMFAPPVDDLGLYSYEQQMQMAAGPAYVGDDPLFSATYWPRSGYFGNSNGSYYDPLICPPSVATPSVPVIPAVPAPIPTVGEDGEMASTRPVRRSPAGSRYDISRSSSAVTGSSASGGRSSFSSPRPSASRSPRPSSSSAAQTVTR